MAVYTELFVVLGDLAVYAQRARAFHWNITGSDFYTYHLLFDRIYTDAAEQVDPVAEHIRSLGSPAPATFTGFVALSGLTETPTAGVTGETAVVEMLADTVSVMASIHAALVAAQAPNTPDNQATIQLCSGLLSVFGVFKYLLSAAVESTEVDS